MPSALARHWPLDPAVTFLNHGSFGACPRPSSTSSASGRTGWRRQPVRFLARELDGRLRDGRERRSARSSAPIPTTSRFVTNATGAVNAVVRSLQFEPGDEILTTDHEYNAILNVLRHVAERDRRPGRSSSRCRSRAGLADDVVERMLAAASEPDAARRRQPRDEPDGPRPPDRAARPGARRSAGSTRSSTAPTRRACSRSTSTRSAPPTTRAISTSGSARRRARRSSTSGAIARPASGPARSPTAPTRRSAARSRFRLEFDWQGTLDPTPGSSVPAAHRVRRWPGRGRLAGGHGPQPRPRPRGARRARRRPRRRADRAAGHRRHARVDGRRCRCRSMGRSAARRRPVVAARRRPAPDASCSTGSASRCRSSAGRFRRPSRRTRSGAVIRVSTALYNDHGRHRATRRGTGARSGDPGSAPGPRSRRRSRPPPPPDPPPPNPPPPATARPGRRTASCRSSRAPTSCRRSPGPPSSRRGRRRRPCRLRRLRPHRRSRTRPGA